jgi:aminopeptidase N
VANYLDLARQLSDETEHAVWETTVASLRMIDDLIVGSPAHNEFRAFARNLMRPVLERVGWNPRPDDTAESLLVRALAISTLGRLRDDAVIGEARARFAALVQKGVLHKDLRGPVATAVGHSADRRIYEDLRRLAGEAAGDEEKMMYYLALAGAGEPELIEETVKIARSDPNLPRAQAGRFLERAAAASGDAERVWMFAHEQRHEILERLADIDRQKVLPNIARLTSSPSIAFELKWGSETRHDQGMRLRADEAVEEIEARAEFKLRLVPGLEAWLKDARG